MEGTAGEPGLSPGCWTAADAGSSWREAPDPCWTAPWLGRSGVGVPRLRPLWKDLRVGNKVFGPGQDPGRPRTALGDTVLLKAALDGQVGLFSCLLPGTWALNKHVPRGQEPSVTPGATPASPLPRRCAERQAQPLALSALAPKFLSRLLCLPVGRRQSWGQWAGAGPIRQVRAEKKESEWTVWGGRITLTEWPVPRPALSPELPSLLRGDGRAHPHPDHHPSLTTASKKKTAHGGPQHWLLPATR